MIDPGAGLGIRGRVLLVLLVCITFPLGSGCSSDPECIAVPFLPPVFRRRRRGENGGHGNADQRQGAGPRRCHRHHHGGLYISGVHTQNTQFSCAFHPTCCFSVPRIFLTASHATTALGLPYGQGEQCWLS